MCGILGYSLKAGYSLHQSILGEAVADLQHRGPDGSGQVFSSDGRIGLGHVRLSIVDLSDAGRQPMTTLDGRYTLSYNGELYDFQLIRDALKSVGVKFSGHSDTEVLLHKLSVDGIDSITSLNGMFAFALWDHESDEIILARDGFGIKPLYFSEDTRGLFFASEVRALLRLRVVPEPLAPLQLARYLQNLWNQAGCLPSENLRKLGPGEAMLIHRGEVVRHWKWHVPAHLSPVHLKLPADKAALELATLLRQSVERQLISDVPVGAFLSGGLDSSAIVAFAKEKLPDIACFTIATIGGTDIGTTDDLPYARRVAAHLDVPLHEVEIDPTRMARDLQAMICQLEEPVADPACLNVYYISRLARDCGIKVLMSGAGSDDLFTGYRRHFAVNMDHNLRWLPLPLRRATAAAVQRLGMRSSTLRRLNKFVEGIALDGNDRLINYFAWTAKDEILRVLSDDFSRQVRTLAINGPMVNYLETMSKDSDAMDRILALEQRFFLAEHNLNYTDKMSMAASVEVRVPFLDPDLARFAAALPTMLKQNGKEGKWILKKAMEPYLPRNVIYRSKTGFGAPLRTWMRAGLQDVMDDLLSEATISARGVFNPVEILRLRQDNAEGRRDNSYTLFSAMCIEMWARHFLDGEPSNSLSLVRSEQRRSY